MPCRDAPRTRIRWQDRSLGASRTHVSGLNVLAANPRAPTARTSPASRWCSTTVPESTLVIGSRQFRWQFDRFNELTCPPEAGFPGPW